MRNVNKILAALLVLAILYLGYMFTKPNDELLFTVYDVDSKYALTDDDYDITIVDFGAYGCPHCQEFHPILMEAINRDGKVRYVPRVISFGAEWSDTLIAAVYAAGEQGKFIEMHNMLYDKTDIANKETLLKYSKEIGLDIDKLSSDMLKKHIIGHAIENKMFFDKWKLKRTPSLLMDKKAIYTPGSTLPTVEELLEKFALARE